MLRTLSKTLMKRILQIFIPVPIQLEMFVPIPKIPIRPIQPKVGKRKTLSKYFTNGKSEIENKEYAAKLQQGKESRRKNAEHRNRRCIVFGRRRNVPNSGNGRRFSKANRIRTYISGKDQKRDPAQRITLYSDRDFFLRGSRSLP